jgi:low temperature requirement protein LtrA
LVSTLSYAYAPYEPRLTKIGVAAAHLRMIMSSDLRKATWLELFYDLIFAVAIAKATHILGHSHQGHIAAELYLKYILIMIPLWWAWTGYTLFVNLYGGDDTLQRLMALSQMACAIALSMFIDPNFDLNYRGFLLSYVAFRSLLILLHWRAASLMTQGDQAGRYLAKGFAIGVLISLSSLAFRGIWKYVVLYLGIAFDMSVPLYGRRRLKTIPAEGHHLPERYGLFTIILLGESITNLAITFEQASWFL